MNTLSFLILSAFHLTYSLPMDQNNNPYIVPAPFSNLQESTNRKIAQLVNSKTIDIVPHFPKSGRKHAVLEQESLVSKADTAYGNLQQFVASFYNPKPVVDTIQEHEKYGNDGGKSRQVSVAIIAGVEGFSNVLNTAVDAPFEVVRQIGRKFSDTVGTVGAKLNGL